jgi:hypothetical protein
MRQIKNKIVLVLAVLLYLNHGMVEAQSPHWFLTPNQLMPPVSPIVVPGVYATPYYAANCGYDVNGNILFYINDGRVYNTAGNVVGNLTPANGYNSKNIIIIPDPGDCNARLVIHTSGDIIVGQGNCYHVTFLKCTKIITAGSNFTILQNYSSATLSQFLSNCNLYIGITVSKPQPNGNRFLYVADDTRVYKYLVDPSGISRVQDFVVISGNKPTDLELSPSGDKLAWSDANIINGIRWITLDANGNFQTYNSMNTTSFGYSSYGLEFIDNNKVMISAGNGANGGIYEGDLAIPASVQKINNTTFSNSQLEKALDGRIYGASANGLFGIDPVNYNNTISVTMPITSNLGFQINSYFSIPNQLDGENYSQVFSCLPPCFPNVFITGNYFTPLTESQTWIKSVGITTIQNNVSVKLDADPVNGYVLLMPASNTDFFLSKPTGNGVFIAQALDGCGPGVPVRPSQQDKSIPVINKGTTISDKSIAGYSVNRFTIFPNPATGQITIQHPADVSELQLYDISGKMVLSTNTKIGNVTQMDLSSLSSGIYFLRADGQPVKKIVKQ